MKNSMLGDSGYKKVRLCGIIGLLVRKHVIAGKCREVSGRRGSNYLKVLKWSKLMGLIVCGMLESHAKIKIVRRILLGMTWEIASDKDFLKLSY